MVRVVVRCPATEEVADLGEVVQLFVVGGCGGVLDGARQVVERVDNSVLWSYLWLGEVVVEGFNGVGD